MMKQHCRWLCNIEQGFVHPGVGLGCLNLGDAEHDIISLLGQPDNLVAVYAIGEPDANGLQQICQAGDRISHYALQYFERSVFLGIFTDPQGRQIISIRLRDEEFDKARVLPRLPNGGGIGTTRMELDRLMGKPAQIHDHCNGDTDYIYAGVGFSIKKDEDKVYSLDVKKS